MLGMCLCSDISNSPLIPTESDLPSHDAPAMGWFDSLSQSRYDELAYTIVDRYYAEGSLRKLDSVPFWFKTWFWIEFSIFWSYSI